MCSRHSSRFFFPCHFTNHGLSMPQSSPFAPLPHRTEPQPQPPPPLSPHMMSQAKNCMQTVLKRHQELQVPPPPPSLRLPTSPSSLDPLLTWGMLQAILYSFPAVCWLYGAGLMFSSFASLVFWGQPAAQLYELLRTCFTIVRPRWPTGGRLSLLGFCKAEPAE